jgi:RNA polymerase sigma-70 factor (ECF subfamily)
MMKCAQPIAGNFDSEYIAGLLKGDGEIEKHFAAYFSHDLDHWLRRKLRSSALVEDIRQETLRRVLEMLHRGALREPNRLASFVHGICKRVLLEYWRKNARVSVSDDLCESSDESFDPEHTVCTAESVGRLRTALLALPPESRRLLSMVYFEERDRAEVSRCIGVNQNYLRVLIHRAILRLRSVFHAAAPRAGLTR